VIEVKSVWTSLNVTLALKRPVLSEWQAIPGRFFIMIYDALAGVVPMNSKEFSVLPANQLSEVRAKYAIYGGASSVYINPDALVFDFPSLLPKDTAVVQQILARVHDAFPKAFPELTYETINGQSFEHLEFINENSNPADYLMRFMFANATTQLGGEPVVFQPAGKCDIIAQDQSWKCTLGVERSLHNARAVFVAITFSLNKVNPNSPFRAKAELVRRIAGNCHQLLGLEIGNVAG
jgi:hypothetical protein